MLVANLRHRGRAVVLAVVLAAAAATLIGTQAAGAADPPVTCTQHKADGSCVTTVTGGGNPGSTGSPGTGGGNNGGGAPQVCKDQGKVVPCYDPTFGYFYTDPYGGHEYVKLMSPQPPKSDPSWEGHTDGAIYEFVIIGGCGQCTGGGWMWLQNPPPGAPLPVDPAVVAATIRSNMNLPTPTFHRSPKENNNYQGQPLTYVNIPTWYWTDPADYQTKTDSLTVGGVTVTVTAAPTSLVFDPGNGDAAKNCDGPGQAWTSADGNDAAPGGCSYSYSHVSSSGPITSQLTVNWGISWTASTGANGVLAPLFSRAQSTFNVLQVQVVDR
ncbi:MAG: hypothetical protein M3Y42_11810 [Actinomycetota bacterium]|nr:hypothetical protein [Actinomycetota bacterium]